MNWIKIILYLLIRIVEGLSPHQALLRTSQKFNVPIEDIIRHL